MGKKGGSKKPPNAPNSSPSSVPSRNQAPGRTQAKGVARDSKSFLKVEHLHNLALWASKEASIPSLAAFFGRQLAAAEEASAIPPDPNLFSCQRCETILQPGFNCTVRIEKTSAKARQRCKKHNSSSKNNVVYNCHFCSHRNLKRGTPKGHMKEICPPKEKKKPPVKQKPLKTGDLEDEKGGKEETSLPDSGETSIVDSPVTPAVRSCAKLLDAKKRKRNRSGLKSTSAANKDVASANAAASSKRRKSWTSLKQITESKEHGSNFSIPFFI